MKSGDPEVSALIRSAIVPLSEAAADLRRAYEDGTTRNLIDFLRSNAELLPPDRDLLADLLAGELGRRKGRQNLKVGATDKRAEAVRAYRERMTARPKPRKDAAIQAVADHLGLSFEQVGDIVRKAGRRTV